MTERRNLEAAVAAGALAGEEAHHALLTSIVQVARAIFHARAASILLLDDDTDELVFEAVTGEGEQTLIGTRFPSGVGIAGWVAGTRQPLVLEDVTRDQRFAAGFADSTGYVPRGIMAVPLLFGERCLGVLEVLDRPDDTRFTVEESQLLGLFAHQAAIAVDLLRRARAAAAALNEADGRTRTIAGIAEAAAAAGDDAVVGEFLESLAAVLQRLRESGGDDDDELERMI